MNGTGDGMTASKPRRHRIPLSDREIAGKLLLRLARHTRHAFCLCEFYDDDLKLLCDLAKDLGLPENFPMKSYMRRLRRVCNSLCDFGILGGQVRSCHKEYLGEPVVLKEYELAEPSYAFRLAPDLYPHYRPMGSVEGELDFMLRFYGKEDAGELEISDDGLI